MMGQEIVKRDSAGKLRTWQYEVEGKSYRTIAGIKGGNLVTSAWTVCVGKQKRNDEEQALFEGNAEQVKKLDREYRLTEAELDSVPPSPMLAKKYEDEHANVASAFAQGKMVYSQPKLDGIRAFVSRHGAFSREYQRHLNVDHVLKALAPVFAKTPDLILDGELYNHDLKEDFNKIASVVRKQKPSEDQRAEALALIQYHVYDVASAGAKVFGDRYLQLMNAIAGAPPTGGVVHLVPTCGVESQTALDTLNGTYIEEGYEGQMVRLNAPYEVDKRSKYLLKRKEFDTAEFKLLHIREGQGNWAGYAKQVIFQLADGRECGGGIRGNQDEMKALLGLAFLGKVNEKSTVTIRHFKLTPDGMPRFPVAIDVQLDGRKD
jgi:DNA ligase-1